MFLFTGPGPGQFSVLPDGHDHERDLHPLAEIRAARVHRGVPGHPEITAIDRRLRPEGGGDLAAERVLGLAEIARVQDDRPRHAVDAEVARYRPVRRVDGLDAGALEGDGRMVLAAE